MDNLNSRIISKYNNEIQFKKNLTLSVNNIITDVENLYTMNYSIIEDVKLIDSNQTSFYEEAKEIFNHLKINHSKKLQEYHMIFESLSHMQTNANSLKEIKRRGNSFSGNRMYNENNNIKNNSSKKSSNTKKYFEFDNKAELNENNYSNININTFAEQVLEFFNKMKTLQESIIKKLEGTNQMKIDFEKYKRKLIKLVNYILNNKSNSNQINLIKLKKDDFHNENNKSFNLEIIEVENFQILGEIKFDNKMIDISEMQNKYNNLLEEINNKSQEINKLQDKINNIQSENNQLKRKIIN